MKLWKRLLALGLSASLCLALAACQNGEGGSFRLTGSLRVPR